MTERRRARWKRDTTLVTFALGLGAVETLFFGGRASVFTFCLGILVSPVVLRVDESRREEP